MDYQIARRRVLDLLPKGDIGAEIGVWKGDFTEKILRCARPARLIAIDPWVRSRKPIHVDAWYGSRAGVDMEAIFLQVRTRFRAEISSGQLDIRRQPSSDALPQIGPNRLGFIYIDGDHTYESVRSDLLAAIVVCRRGALICLDDHYVGGWWKDAVVRAAAEFLDAHKDRCAVRFSGGGQLVIEVLDNGASGE